MSVDEDNAMKTSKSALCAVVVLMLGFSVAVSPQQAFADHKVHPATMCVKLAGGANISRGFGGMIRNTSPAAPLFVQCDIVNELGADAGPPFLRIKGGLLKTTDRNPDKELTCALYQTLTLPGPLSSGTFFMSDSDHTTGASGDSQPLLFDPPDPNSSFGYTNFFQCNIPPAVNGAVSELHNYQILEDRGE
jgi:hypothetical protein